MIFVLLSIRSELWTLWPVIDARYDYHFFLVIIINKFLPNLIFTLGPGSTTSP